MYLWLNAKLLVTVKQQITNSSRKHKPETVASIFLFAHRLNKVGGTWQIFTLSCFSQRFSCHPPGEHVLPVLVKMAAQHRYNLWPASQSIFIQWMRAQSDSSQSAWHLGVEDNCDSKATGSAPWDVHKDLGQLDCSLVFWHSAACILSSNQFYLYTTKSQQLPQVTLFCNLKIPQWYREYGQEEESAVISSVIAVLSSLRRVAVDFTTLPVLLLELIIVSRPCQVPLTWLLLKQPAVYFSTFMMGLWRSARVDQMLPVWKAMLLVQSAARSSLLDQGCWLG